MKKNRIWQICTNNDFKKILLCIVDFIFRIALCMKFVWITPIINDNNIFYS